MKKRRIIYEKLQLKDSDRLLDIGCGWGSIILESATLYNIRSVGITISKNQYEFVKEKIKELGLKDRVDVYLMHYEDLPRLGEQKFFEVVSQGTEDGGLFLLHTIGKVYPSSQSRWIRI